MEQLRRAGASSRPRVRTQAASAAAVVGLSLGLSATLAGLLHLLLSAAAR